ncbi:MAG: serpin family protein, partial [Candidatus Eremiobacteraeota bacterium]|nr:serpin family protein [Candidatus Eremiobacteraeota bacterium]
FHVAGGGSVIAPLMHAHIPVLFGGLPNAQVGVLPFAGKDLSLVVIVPDQPDGLPAVEAQLTAPALTAAIDAAMSLGEASDVTLPKFQILQDVNLIPVLENLGVHEAFGPDVADFSGIDGARDLYVQTVFHDAMISVDEQGAEAAAATGVGVGIASAPPSLVADHSFAFVLYDHVTGSILFMGRLLDPTQP